MTIVAQGGQLAGNGSEYPEGSGARTWQRGPGKGDLAKGAWHKVTAQYHDKKVMDCVMAKVEIYTSMMCGYCARALRLLDSKKAAYREIDVSMSSALRAEMRARAGGRSSVPQIFIDGEHVGGCAELYELEGAGRLDDLLAA